jgi:hypothetical protein
MKTRRRHFGICRLDGAGVCGNVLVAGGQTQTQARPDGHPTDLAVRRGALAEGIWPRSLQWARSTTLGVDIKKYSDAALYICF